MEFMSLWQRCGGPQGGEETFKKMCWNCAFRTENEDGSLICSNEDNCNDVANKMLEAAKQVSSGYNITSLQIEPLPLKKPSSKCGRWELCENVREQIESLFV